ncbi:MAG: hypothetical protein ACREOV_07030 [Candidatus Dormibacteraceae bacterium]
MTDERRPVLLVGSIPLGDAREVFREVGSTLGDLVARVPDGETGVRKDWIGWQSQVFDSAEGLVEGAVRPLQGGYEFHLKRVGPGGPGAVRFGPLGYAAAAKASYREFSAARVRGELPAGVRFQVSLPSSLAVVISFTEPDDVQAVWPVYQQRLIEEVVEIAGAIPHQDLAIQWDLAAEICFVLEVPEVVALMPMSLLVAAIARESAAVPADVELGLHLCYGDPGHKHVVEPKDTALMVEFTHALLAAIAHPIAWVHMPVPRGRDDEEYFAPLSDLRLPRETQLFLGLVHLTDGTDGAGRRLRAARAGQQAFGIATECGFGRRDPATVPELLALHRAIADLG